MTSIQPQRHRWLPAVILAPLIAVGCADDQKETTCDRYKRLADVMSRSDPEYWSKPQSCPSDGQVAAHGWPQMTLRECVDYLEERCSGVDVDACTKDEAVAVDCGCSVGLGLEREICTPD